MNAIILGSESDIAKQVRPMMEKDGWEIATWKRGGGGEGGLWAWNLVFIALGSVAPVGDWKARGWNSNFESNILLPVQLLSEIWNFRRPFSSVCFLAGSNPQKIMPGYAAYNASKMALLKVVEQLDYETPDCKFFALGPGYIDTKIHAPTKAAQWPNERIARGNPNTVEQVYDCLKWCISQPKEVVGGRNICVSDPYGPELAERLKANANLYKLRRIE